MSLKFEVVSVESIPSSGKPIAPENAELYRAIGRLEVKDCLKLVDTIEVISKVYNSIQAHFGGIKQQAKMGFAIKCRKLLKTPSEKYCTLYIYKVKDDMSTLP